MFDSYREFRVLATHLSFTRAALELNVSEPTLSKHIAELERTVGCALVNRNPVSLTEAGIIYLEQFSCVLDEASAVFERCRSAGNGRKVELRVAQLSHRDSFTSLFNRALVKVNQKLSNFKYSFETDRGSTVAQCVLDGAADVGIVYVDDPSYFEGLEMERICERPYGILVDRRGPFADREILFEELAEARVATSSNRKLWILSDSVRYEFAKYGIQPKFFMGEYDVVLNHVLDMQPDELLIAGRDLVYSLQIDNPNLVEARIVNAHNMVHPICLLHRPGDPNPAIPLLVEELRRAAQRFGDADSTSRALL